MKYNNVFLSLGSNISGKKKNIETAFEFIKQNNKISILKLSSIYESPPWGYKNQENFYNQVIEIETNLEPYELLVFVKSIEKKMGRQTAIKWGPRNIDIDILIFSDIIIKGDFLNIPHRFLLNRCFWLVGLNEINEQLNISGKNVWALLEREQDRDLIKIVC
ncbi:2-amino-4-hydroxy-6- hydroxymethyldihydropteridine pyrophosphokinase [Desulfurella amilsii]|uniref:2-amino-4-hydroxy-6-hydroxymethyldihydropteridine pyrophosphokinase n=1 Tax=Desulfurella amilsii TaxID=1562698 RepID=A0A1X4XZD8_9BACT|nr:2-amino-4-hydroxy-6-hydroxymethyldihydropteridine diphosphokinase [Desulfurella amilsii]OSS42911.1 2-amino-4-hydroxy-6- hydroxymethyldihydropteridine pyrophosphokinase [Desulfurella amilsii]